MTTPLTAAASSPTRRNNGLDVRLLELAPTNQVADLAARRAGPEQQLRGRGRGRTARAGHVPSPVRLRRVPRRREAARFPRLAQAA